MRGGCKGMELCALLCTAALTWLSACAHQPVMSEPDRSASLRPDLRVERLENGLTIYMVTDNSAPLVSYQVWFKVGSVNEHEAGPNDDHGITGLSHFFEHMMFRGTEKHPKYFDEIYSLGAKLNAYTWLDETVYWEKIPSQHLETVIHMEADRLEHMTIDFLNLEPEREVVKSERLLRTDNRPQGLAWEILQSRAFERFPYHWGTIGWMSDLNAITVAEAQRYHDVYYAPNNAYIIVVGDHDPDETLAWIDAAYGHLPPREIPPESFPEEPRQTEERRDRLIRAVEPPLVMFGYRAPAVRTQDFAILEVLDAILSGGKSSRLQQALVYSDPPRVNRLFSHLFPMRHPYLYVWGANLQPGEACESILQVIDGEVARVISDGVSETELKRAVAGLRSDVVRQNLSNNSRADLMGFSIRATDDPYTFFDRLQTYGDVTSEDVQRVARQVLDASQRTVVPVVDPSRVEAIVQGFVDAAGSLPTGVGTATIEAIAIILQAQQIAQTRTGLDAEALAIEHLKVRAQRHRDAGDADTQQAIDTYLEENEKGVMKRLARLESSRGEWQAAANSLQTRKRSLAKEFKKLKRRRWDPDRYPVSLFMRVIETVVAPLPLDLERLAPRSPVGHHDTAMFATYTALLSWVFDARAMSASAQSYRERVLDMTQLIFIEDPDLLALINASRSLAWDTRVTGIPLVDSGADPLAQKKEAGR